MPEESSNALILRVLDGQDRTLARIETKVDGLEPRVDRLESARDVHAGRTDWMKYVPPALVACLGSGIGLLALVLK